MGGGQRGAPSLSWAQWLLRDTVIEAGAWATQNQTTRHERQQGLQGDETGFRASGLHTLSICATRHRGVKTAVPKGGCLACWSVSCHLWGGASLRTGSSGHNPCPPSSPAPLSLRLAQEAPHTWGGLLPFSSHPCPSVVISEEG